ncbi:tryptophan synthase subunit alpha [Paracoccus sp. p4-l81]|uniref:tryptophan synthase subunit alpha n=1 Tax=Paracoccus sp. p4-l81 TaxID=3342806 RepID=UPI0035B840A9
MVLSFGIATPEAVARVADGCVVGSAIVKKIAEARPVDEVLAFVAELAQGAHRG